MLEIDRIASVAILMRVVSRRPFSCITLCLMLTLQVGLVLGPGHPSSPLSIYFLIFSPFHFSISFISFTYSSFVHPFPFYQNSLTPFPGRRSQETIEPGFSVCFVLYFAYLYSLVKMDCGVLLYLVSFFVCSFSALTLLVGSFDP